MTVRALAAAAFVSAALGTLAAPASAQATRTVRVMGMAFQQPVETRTQRAYDSQASAQRAYDMRGAYTVLPARR